MRFEHLTAGLFTLLAWTGLAHSAQPQPTEQLEELDTVLVVGEQPGPGLWKVSKDDHVMWVLASYGPLPKGMTWRSQQIEARISESQEVLYPGSVNIRPDIGVLKGITLIPAALKAGKNPDGAKLKQVLPPETYAKWLVLREKYVGRDDDIEKWRPTIALQNLRSTAFRKNGLSDGPRVDDVVQRAAKKYKVRIHRLPTLERVVRTEDPRGMLKSVQKIQAPDLACFTRDLDLLESGVELAKVRANAWARGDIAKLRELHRVRPLQDECGYVLMTALTDGTSSDAVHAKKLVADLMWHAEQAGVQGERDWIAAAQAAIEKNKSTFAVLDLNQVLLPDGLMARLRALGYTVEEPR